MQQHLKLDRVALANTFAAIDIVLHVGIHVWVALSPETYEYLMALFVAGFRPEVTHFDISISHILTGTLIEAVVFWSLGFVGATVYNWFASFRK